jgi:hypothetical protein
MIALVPQAFGLQQDHLPPAQLVAGLAGQFGGVPGLVMSGGVVPPLPAFARSQLCNHERGQVTLHRHAPNYP